MASQQTKTFETQRNGGRRGMDIEIGTQTLVQFQQMNPEWINS
jgi:hypothetical protein